MFAVIAIPDFFLQAVLRHEPELHGVPVALVDDDSAKSPVWQVTGAARRKGVTPGITSTQAKGRYDRIVFRLRSAAQEQSAQEILLECAYACAAYIESTGSGICTVDLRGLPLLQSEDLAATLESWGGQVLERLAQFNLAGRVGIADTPSLALQAAQAAQGDNAVRYISDRKQFWDEARIGELCTSDEAREVLRKWGISTVSAFLALGKTRIAERLGAEGAALYQVALADQIRPLNLTTPKQLYEESFEFEQPVEMLEPLLFILRRFIDQITRRLELGSMVVQELAISLKLESGSAHERQLKIPAPTRDVEVLFRILHNFLENVRTKSPVIAMSLRAEPCAAETQQFQLFENAVRDPNRFYETLGRLGALLGKDRVGNPVRRDSFKPDDFILEPITVKVVPKKETATFAFQRGMERGLVLRRFRPPLLTTVRLQEGQPASIRNARFNASIVRSSGPFRASGEWWENLWSREEWDVETKQGDLLRLVRERQEWFIDGAYD